MDIATLNAFISVARYESFSKAAEHLFITQPAISKRVAALEEELGTQLFNRIARQTSLTEAGKQLLPKAQDLLEQAEEMQRFASSLHDQISGNLSVAISHHIGLHRMPPILSEFNARYPNVELDILFEDSDQAFHAVEQGDIEFAVITLPNTLPQKLMMQTVWVDPLNVVVGRQHKLAEKSSVSLSELATYPCVMPTQDTETYKVIDREFQTLGLTMSLQMGTNNLETLKMLAGAGLGWSLLPQTMLDDSLHVLDVNCQLERSLGMVFHRKRSLSNAANALKELIIT